MVSAELTDSVPPPADAILSARGVSVRFPAAARDAVRDISFDLAAGETLAIFGPSGSGKSTLALALLGAIPALVPGERSGEVCLRGEALTPGALAPQRMRAASILQDVDAQIVALTVEDEIAFALENRGLAADEIDRRIDRALASPPALGLSRRDRTLELSGGWRQRLSLAAALGEQPELLALDEPVAHLDGYGAKGAIDALASLRAAGCASIIVEHRCDHVAGLVDRALILDRWGAPAMLAPIDEVMRRAAEAPDAFGLRLPPAIIADAALRSVAPADAAAHPVETVLAALGMLRLRDSGRGSFPSLLTMDGAEVRRGRRTVLQSVDLAIGAGEVVGVAGPNGAGKTTLALLAAGALRARRGKIHGNSAPPIYLPQNPALAFASASLAAEAASRRLDWSAVAAALEQVELPPDAARHPLSFSHGERRRLGLAFILAAQEPRLVILDEPTAGLDGYGLSLLRRQIDALRARGCGVMLIAHDLDFLLGACDRIAIVDGGRITHDGAPDAIATSILSGATALRPPDGLLTAVAHGWSTKDAAP